MSANAYRIASVFYVFRIIYNIHAEISYQTENIVEEFSCNVEEIANTLEENGNPVEEIRNNVEEFNKNVEETLPNVNLFKSTLEEIANIHAILADSP